MGHHPLKLLQFIIERMKLKTCMFRNIPIYGDRNPAGRWRNGNFHVICKTGSCEAIAQLSLFIIPLKPLQFTKKNNYKLACFQNFLTWGGPWSRNPVYQDPGGDQQPARGLAGRRCHTAKVPCHANSQWLSVQSLSLLTAHRWRSKQRTWLCPCANYQLYLLRYV